MEVSDAQDFSVKITAPGSPCAKERLAAGDLRHPGIDPEGRVIITSRGTTYKVKDIRPRDREFPCWFSANSITVQTRLRRSG